MNYPEWLHPVAFSVGSFKVYWYGLMYMLGMVLFQMVATFRIEKGRYKGFISRDELSNMVFYIMMGVILGGRLGYVLFYGTLSQWQNDFLWAVKIWQGGMSFHGGFLGVLFALWLFNRTQMVGRGYSAMDFYEFTAPLICIGLGLGRIGNFIGKELYGRETDVPWGIIFHDGMGARHPSQLYEAALEGLVMFLLLYWFTEKPRARSATSGLFCILYGSFRIFVEFFREPDAHMGYYMDYFTMGMFLSLPMVLVGIWFYWYSIVTGVVMNVSNAKKSKKCTHK